VNHRSLFHVVPRLATVAGVIVLLSAAPSPAGTTSRILTPDEITKQLVDQGYTKVIRMEMEDGIYEVKVKDKDGKRQKLNVDPMTGKVLGGHKEGLFTN